MKTLHGPPPFTQIHIHAGPGRLSTGLTGVPPEAARGGCEELREAAEGARGSGTESGAGRRYAEAERAGRLGRTGRAGQIATESYRHGSRAAAGRPYSPHSVADETAVTPGARRWAGRVVRPWLRASGGARMTPSDRCTAARSTPIGAERAASRRLRGPLLGAAVWRPRPGAEAEGQARREPRRYDYFAPPRPVPFVTLGSTRPV